MNVTRFECEKGHTFFIALGFPISIDVMVRCMEGMECPLCDCKSDQIKISAKKFTII